MRCRTKLITVLCALSILAEPSLAADKTPSAASSSTSSSSSSTSQSPAASGFNSLTHVSKDQFPGDKRASAYRSEFKRLPIFTFGLGKRGFAPSFDATSKVQRADYSFGMGKRTLLGFSGGQNKRLISRLMTTGLGKRSTPRYMTTGLGKRSISRLHTTGLGKRLQDSFAMGLGKRLQDSFAMGLGKRGEWKNVGFGLGKRTGGMFGMGKRAPNMAIGLGRRSMKNVGIGLGKRFTNSVGIGLGKRTFYDEDVDEDDDGEEMDYDELLDAYSQDKRKFALGLGKRVMELYTDLPEEDKRGHDLSFGMGKRYFDDAPEEEKRGRELTFGMGKRYVDDLPAEEKRGRDLSFGMGKRYDEYAREDEKRGHGLSFGMGKRYIEDTQEEDKRGHNLSFGMGKRYDEDEDVELFE